LLGGALIALSLHLGTMFTPLGQKILRVEPLSWATMACLWALALSIFLAMELHKRTWAMRQQRKAGP
jgi:hypothetical protein